MRLFIASSFPPDIVRDLDDRVSRVRTRLPAATWTRGETYHVTYAFLGERPESTVADVDSYMQRALTGMKGIDASLRGCGFFPNARHARVGWVGLSPEEAFTSLATSIRAAVKDAGVVLDGADFKPHLTIMRIRDVWPPASIELFTRTLRDFASPPFRVDRVTLYSSQLNPKGAVHTPLRDYPLA